jgi:hypothetical protein
VSQGKREYQVCPRCEAEFTMAVSVCSDCGEELVSPDSVPSEEEEELPPIEELSLIRVAPLAWTRALSEHLSDAGIPHRVERGAGEEFDEDEVREKFGFEVVYGVYVLPDDQEEGVLLDAELLGAGRGATSDEDEPGAGSGAQCPACEAPLESEESECSECGLSFPEAE